MSSSTVSNWGPPQGRYLVLVDEKTGEEVGRCAGFEWLVSTDQDGTAAPMVRLSYDHNTKTRDISGPVKKIGMLQEWQGTMSDAQQQQVKSLETQLKNEYDTSRERLEEIVKLEQRLVSILRMLGGAVSISDFESAEAGNWIVEEKWSTETGTVLNLVERA